MWRYGAEPAAGDARTQVDGTGRLAADIEGVAIATGTGHLVVSSQGSDYYAIYGRTEDNPYLGRFAVGGDTVDGTSHTDGLDVTTAAIGPGQNFKLVRWGVLAAVGLP